MSTNLLGAPSLTRTNGRSLPVTRDNDEQVFMQLNGILMRSGIRRERRLKARYEKPNVQRRRLKSERFRRFFANQVAEKVALVMQMKNKGL